MRESRLRAQVTELQHQSSTQNSRLTDLETRYQEQSNQVEKRATAAEEECCHLREEIAMKSDEYANKLKESLMDEKAK